MYIGELSKRTGLSVKAIRLYEEKGLVKPPLRVGRYRVYQESDIDLFVLIREARDFGIPLSTIKGVIVYKDGEVDWQIIKTFLNDLKSQLYIRIKDLDKKISQIDECFQQNI